MLRKRRYSAMDAVFSLPRPSPARGGSDLDLGLRRVCTIGNKKEGGEREIARLRIRCCFGTRIYSYYQEIRIQKPGDGSGFSES